MTRDELPRTDIRGNLIPDGHLGSPRMRPEAELSPDRMKRRPRAHADLHGRAEATDMVDETVFAKAPVGGMMRISNISANFTIDQSGEFGRR